MIPQEFSVEQLKYVLRQYKLSTSGRKNELISRLQAADPSGGWIHKICAVDEAITEAEYDATALQTEGMSECSNFEYDLNRRELELAAREKEYMVKENERLKREIELLQRTLVGNSHVDSLRTTIDIKNIGKLLNDYDGEGEEFQLWKTQVNTLREMYKFTEGATKLMVGSKLQGKAFRWYRSKAEYLSMNLDNLLKEMEIILDQLLGKMDLRRKFEARKWQKEETFSEYWHEKVILGNRVTLKEEELIEYIIDGIPSESLKNKTRMQSFSSVQVLLKAFKKISLTSEVERRSFYNTQRNEKFFRANRNFTTENEASIRTKRAMSNKEQKNLPAEFTRKKITCYTCNKEGHFARDCNAKDKGVADKKEKK